MRTTGCAVQSGGKPSTTSGHPLYVPGPVGLGTPQIWYKPQHLDEFDFSVFVQYYCALLDIWRNVEARVGSAAAPAVEIATNEKFGNTVPVDLHKEQEAESRLTCLLFAPAQTLQP